MNRNGVLDAQGQVIEIDRLEYGYKADSPNQLATILDHSNHPLGFRDDSTDGLSDPNGDDYSYDDFGNLTGRPEQEDNWNRLQPPEPSCGNSFCGWEN